MLKSKNLGFLIVAAALSAPLLSFAAEPIKADAGKQAFQNKDYATAYREWKPLADKGDANAQFNLGVMFAWGLGVEQDVNEAMRLYHLAADQGNAQAEYRLGYRYAHGWGVQQDFAEASHWYQLAADQGDGAAQTGIARQPPRHSPPLSMPRNLS